MQLQNCVDLKARSLISSRACREAETAREAAAEACLAGAAADAARGKPPVGNTGGKLTVLVDHFNCTTASQHTESVSRMLSAYLGEPEDLGYGFHTYQQARRWQTGALLLSSPDRPEVCLSLNGDTCEFLGMRRLYGLLAALWCLRVKPTRMDCTVDDFGRSFSMDDVHQAAESGNYTRFKKCTPIRERYRVGASVITTSDSIRFGQRGKDGGKSTVMIYDKLLESKGERDCIRVEATMQGEGAQAAFLVLMQDLDDSDTGFDKFIQRIGQVVGDSIDFRERGTETHVDRMPRLSWWDQFVSQLGQVKVSVFKPLVPLVRTINASVKQYAKKFALAKVVLQSKGQDFLSWLCQLIESAELDMSQADWKRFSLVNLDLDISHLVGGSAAPGGAV